MELTQKNCLRFLLFSGLYAVMNSAMSLESSVGVGGGLNYTSNAKLAAQDAVEDVVATTYISGGLSENDGPLVFGVDATLRRENYLNDTFADRSYFNMGLDSKWEMIRDRFDWFLSDRYSQRPVISTAADTPNNTQDSNVFNFGADIHFPVSLRQTFSLVPAYTQYYYESTPTDNRQYSLSANWRYQMTRLLNIGASLRGRKIDYTDRSIQNTAFTSAGLSITGKPVRSVYSLNAGATRVTRENGQEETGFFGTLNLQKEISSRSTISALLSTNLTDASSVAQIDAPGNPDEVQVVADVIRNRVANLTYTREDALLRTSLSVGYQDLVYSERSTQNRTINSFRAQLGFPVTQLTSGAVFLNFQNIDLPNNVNGTREDKRFNFGASSSVSFTERLSGNASIQYRTKESTVSSNNYDEFSIFVGVNYGIGSAKGRSNPGRY